ncbi:MAG: 4Fe-4S binding protein [Chloroflexota bacterium]|nr:4Fe-4S binding protein [Chloroflexota bacterium]
MDTPDVYTEIMHRLNCSGSKIMPRILSKLIAPDEARLLLMLPSEPAELAKQTGIDEDAIKRKLQEFLERGLVFPTSKGPQFARDATQLHDASLSSADRWIDDELLDLWREYHETEWIPSTANIPKEIHIQRIRVLPAIKAIERSPDIVAADFLPDEDIRELIKQADPIAVVPCSCRRSMRRCKNPVDVCLQFNKSAKFHLDRKAGRKLTPGEAIDIAVQAEDEGLIHTWPVRASGTLNELCNCCRDCCVIFDGGLRHNNVDQILEKSRFRAVVDQAECTGCNECIDRCFFGAIELVRSPETKEMTAVIDADKCFGCGVCVVDCPYDAMSMKPA